jgi:hypothetical protein
LVTATDSHGHVATDKIFIYREISSPSIYNIETSSGSVRVYEKYEINFDLDTVAENNFFEYDTNPPPGVEAGKGVNVEGVFITPSGKNLRQPAFFMTETIRTGSTNNQRYKETEENHWSIRFSPQEVGQYQVSIHVRDASGSNTVPLGSFYAQPPIKKGFIEVSDADSRYFEFSNGDIYLPIGPASGNDYSKYVGTGQNFERPWMGGRGAYSTRWARWISSAESHGNEGYNSHLSYSEHYPGHELSQWIHYPNGYRMWLASWLD